MIIFGNVLRARVLFMLLFCFVVALAADKGEKVHFDERLLTYKEIFNQVETQTGLITVFSNNELDMKTKVRLLLSDYSLTDLYAFILKGTDLEYEISEKYVVIRIAHKRSGGEKRKIQGLVTDASNSPLVGATISVKGTGIGTSANVTGNYQLNVPVKENVVLEASFVGMKPMQIVVLPGQTVVDFQLSPNETAIEEVEIVGAYGTRQKRSDLVGSLFQVDQKQLKSLPASRIDNVLEGLIPGLQVTVNTDAASSTKVRYDMRVRGEGSLSASSEPLWVIDGTPVYTGDRTNLVSGMNTSISPLSYINPDDIETITLLKDATAASIYGANGSNGVILVTTKTGKNSKLTVNVSQRNGISVINQSTKFKVLNASQYLMLAREAYVNAGKDLKNFPFQDNAMNSYTTTSTDWSDVFYGKGYTNQTNFSARGGTETAKYYVSGSYYKNQSTIIGNSQERYSTRANVNLKLNKRLSVAMNTTASYNTNTIFNPGDDYYALLPIYSPYNPDGSFRLYNQSLSGYNETTGAAVWSASRFLNSVAEREENDNYQRTGMVNNNLVVELNILKGLTLNSQLGVDYQSANEFDYEARSNWTGMDLVTGEKIGYATRNNATFLTLNAVERLNYDWVFGKSRINAFVALEAGSKGSTYLSAKGTGFVNDKVKEVSYAASTSASAGRSDSRTLSYFTQIAYAYDDRYFLTANGRRDGTSGFGNDSKWESFGSVGFSWNLHNEKFYPFDFIKVFKLKASYGTNGNSRIGTSEALGLYSYSESDNYAGTTGASLSGSPNPTLSWETAQMTNLGLRLKFWNWLDVELEGYWKKTNDLINKIDVSRTTGDTRVYRNSGVLMNKGIELRLEINVINKKNTELFLTFNGSHNKNVLLDLYNGIEKVMGNYLWREGTDVNTLYLIRWAGVDPRDGAPLWYDAKGNITRTYSINNRVAWKSSSPIMDGGFTTSFRYKRMRVNSQFTYVLGGYAFSSFGRNVSSDGYEIMSQNQSINQLDRWQKPGDIATTPKLIWGMSTKSVMNSTRYVYSKTNLKLKNVSVSYDIPPRFYRTLGIKSFALSLIGDNLGIWTPYDKSNRNSYKQSMSGYPMESTFSLGVDISF